MCKIYHILVLAAFFWTLVDCQGGRGVGARVGVRSRYGGSTSSSSSSCTDEDCLILLFVSLVVVFSVCAVSCLCLCLCKGRARKDNATFVNTNSEHRTQEVHETNRNEAQMQNLFFQTGIWACRYFQYGHWHGPYEYLLSFNPGTMKITGWGCDNIGKFTVTGDYSEKARRIGLTKTYQPGTGDRKQNLGHDVVIQLKQNADLKRFEGKWYVQTKKYRGEDKFTLEFVREREFCEV